MLLYLAALARPTREVVTAAAGEHTDPALEAAAAAGVIEADGSRLRFTHPLLASTHYGSASRDERARVHRRLAEVVTDAEERGRHLGATAEEPDAEVAAALDAAATAARARGAPASAAELAEIALRLTSPTDPASLSRRLCAAADHQFAAGSTTRARTLLEQAFADAPRGPERARVALQLAAQLGWQDYVAERSLLDQALRDAGADPRLRAEIHLLAAVLHQDIDFKKSAGHARAALAPLERTEDAALIAPALSAVAMADFFTGKGIDHALHRRGVALEERLPRLDPETSPAANYAFALKWSGDVEAARPILERLRARAAAEGDMGLMTILFYSAFHELIAEDWEQATRLAGRTRALAVEAERAIGVASGFLACAVVAAYRGQVERARAGTRAPRDGSGRRDRLGGGLRPRV